MNEDTIKLLKECNAGCKYATNSMEQVKPYIHSEKLKELINKYNDKHIELGDEFHELLNECQEDEKDPNPVSRATSWISTEVKLMINDDAHRIAELMIDGCNMGIKSISEFINKYKAASRESIHKAEKLVGIEQEFMDDLKAYL